jgi:hypothetical protein
LLLVSPLPQVALFSLRQHQRLLLLLQVWLLLLALLLAACERQQRRSYRQCLLRLWSLLALP